MAWTNKHVSALAEGGGDGSVERPWTLAEYLAAVAGEKGGTEPWRATVRAGVYPTDGMILHDTL